MLLFFKHSPYSPAPTRETLSCLGGFGTAAEMVSLSFSLSAPRPIAHLELTPSDLEGPAGVIPRNCISLYIVKIWEQAGMGVYQSAPLRVAELLLKDDRAPINDSYTRRGRCWHWKHLLRASQIYEPPNVRLEGNACTSLGSYESKQVWVSVKIPADVEPGLYSGYLEAKTSDETCPLKRLELQLEVLPIRLLQPEQDLFLWYKGTLDCRRPQHYLSKEIFRAQLQDIYDHGFRSISLNEYEPEHLQQAVNLAHSIGFNRNLVLTAPYPERFSKIDFKQLTPIYYISDEMDARDEPAAISDHIEKWRRVRSAGGQTMWSLLRQTFARRFLRKDGIGCAPDLLSYYLPANLRYFLAYAEFQRLRAGKTYYYWQSHMEKPDVHRVLAGLYLWKSGADGIAPYCYQHLPKPPASPFNDFDEWEPGFHLGTVRRRFKDHMTTYPARAGSIPTLQWKGIADGIYDLRYLLTFDAALKRAEACHSRSVQAFMSEARVRCEQFLNRISLKEININSATNSAPYKGIRSEEYAGFREQLARDLVTLSALMNRAELRR